MKHIFFLTFFIAGTFFISVSEAQPTYTMADFAASGDTFFLTQSQYLGRTFDSSGASFTWNYAGLTGISQRREVFRLPSQTGFNTLQWPYIFNNNNVNLSATDGQTTTVLGIQQSNPNTYFLKSDNLLREKAQSFTMTLNGLSYNVRTVYNSPDTLYHFPILYGNTYRSNASYTIQIPGVYYRGTTLNRRDTVKGWGNLATPFTSYANVLQLFSTIMQTDSVSIISQGISTVDTTVLREIRWLDPSLGYPVMTVWQRNSGGQFITNRVEYADRQLFFQPSAFFAYVPISPVIGDTLVFQNLSSNAVSYKWNFGDGSGENTATNPSHVYTQQGVYPVTLIAFNGALQDTFTLNVRVNPVNQSFSFIGSGNWSDPANWSGAMVPPQVLPAGSTIFVRPSAGGDCILDITQTIAAGASLTIASGVRLILPGNLRIQ